MLDAVNLERLGIPSVTVATTPFVHAARSVATAQGMEGHPLVVVPPDLDADVDGVAAQIVAALFAPVT